MPAQADLAFAAQLAGIRLHREPALREAVLDVLRRAGVRAGAAEDAAAALIAYAAGAAVVEASDRQFAAGVAMLLDGMAY